MLLVFACGAFVQPLCPNVYASASPIRTVTFCTQIGEYAQKVKQKQLKGRETAAVRARKLSNKGAARPGATRTSGLTALTLEGRAGLQARCSEDEEGADEEDSDVADEYFDGDGE
jgi:hypothetical protein